MIGLWKLDICLSIIGIITVYLTKMWFLDRMVWIFEEMNNEHTTKNIVHLADSAKNEYDSNK
jgi:hypothetical protein